jgi:hypothetical protein
MAVSFGPGFHSVAGQRVDRSAYDRYLGRWSRLFVPATLTAAEVGPSHRTLDVATGPGEAAYDGQALPFANGSFDSVICQLGLMFFPDPARRAGGVPARPEAERASCGVRHLHE